MSPCFSRPRPDPCPTVDQGRDHEQQREPSESCNGEIQREVKGGRHDCLGFAVPAVRPRVTAEVVQRPATAQHLAAGAPRPLVHRTRQGRAQGIPASDHERGETRSPRHLRRRRDLPVFQRRLVAPSVTARASSRARRAASHPGVVARSVQRSRTACSGARCSHGGAPNAASAGLSRRARLRWTGRARNARSLDAPTMSIEVRDRAARSRQLRIEDEAARLARRAAASDSRAAGSAYTSPSGVPSLGVASSRWTVARNEGHAEAKRVSARQALARSVHRLEPP